MNDKKLKIGSMGLITLMVIMALSGGFGGIAAAQESTDNNTTNTTSYDYEPTCANDASRAGYMYPSRYCSNSQVAYNDMIESDNVTKLTLLQNLESNAQFADETNTIFGNYLEDTSQVAFVEARAAVGESWETGDNETQAVEHADEEIADYYGVKKVNMLNVFNHVILNAGYANDEAGEFNYTAQGDAYTYMFSESNEVGGNQQTYIVRPTGNYTEMNVSYGENGNETVNTTVPHIEIFNIQSETVVYDGVLYENVSNDLDMQNNNIAVQTDNYGTVNVSIGLTLSGFETQDGNETSRSLFDGNTWTNRYGEIESQSSTVQNNFDSALVNDTYTALNDGDIEVADLLGMNGLVSELSGDSTVTSDRFKMAMYRILNIGSADLNTTSSITGTYTGFTDTNAVYNDETDTRAVHNSNWTSEQAINGMMFTKNVSLANGDTVAVDPFADEQYNDTYEEYGFSLDWRNSTPYVDVYKNGEIVETQEVNNPNNYDSGNSDLFNVNYNGEYNKLVVGEVTNITVYEFNTTTDNVTDSTQIQEEGHTLHGASDGYITLGDDAAGSTDKSMTTIRLSDNAHVTGTPTGQSVIRDVGGTNETAYVVGGYEGLYEVNFSNGTYDELVSNVVSKTDNLDLSIIDNQMFFHDNNHIAGTTTMVVYNLSAGDYSQDPADNTVGNEVYNVSFDEYTDVYALGEHVYYTNGSMYADDGVKVSDAPSRDVPISDTFEEGDDTAYDDVTGITEFIDARSDNNEKTLSNGVFTVNNMTDTNGTKIKTVTNETLDYLVNQTGVNNSSVIVDDMDRFNSTDDIDGTDDVEAVCEYYETSECDAPVNSQNWDGGANYSTTNTTEFAQEIDEIKSSINTIQSETYDDGSGELPGFGDGWLGQFLGNLGLAGGAAVVVVLYFVFGRD